MYTRENSPKVAEWKVEQARGQRRSQLGQTMHEAEVAMANGPIAKTADPGRTSYAG